MTLRNTPPIAAINPVAPWRDIAGIVLVIAAGILYALTLDNGLQTEELVGGDLITHQYAQVQGRPSNAPGYPLYTIGGWLWFHGIRSSLHAFQITTPNPIPILSAYSMLWALLALWLLYRVICMATESERRPSGNIPAAFLVSVFYAVTYFFWYYATTTEQYSSAVAQTLAIVLVLMLWLRRPERLGLLFALAFLCGLSLAHMVTVAFIAPATVAAVLWVRPSLLRDPKAVTGSLLAALVPLLSYAWVYTRGSQHPEWWGNQHYDSTGDWFWSFVSTSQGRDELMWAFEPGRPLFGNGYPDLVGQELSWLIVLTGLVGIFYLRRPLPFVILSTLAIYVVFSWFYRFGNWFQVILPAYALLMIGVGVLCDRIQYFAFDMTERWTEYSGQRMAHVMLFLAPLMLLVVAIVWRFDASIARADSLNRSNDSALNNAAIYLSAALPPGSAVFASVEDALAMQYLTDIWAVRPDLDVISSADAASLDAGQRIFSTWDAANTLREEMPETLSVNLRVVSPNWVELVRGRVRSGDADYLIDNEWAIEFQEPIAEGLILDGVQIAPSTHNILEVDDVDSTYDMIVEWIVQHEWPEGLAISVRPTIHREFITDPGNPESLVQTDRSLPAQLQFAQERLTGDRFVADPYRLEYPGTSGDEELGVAILLYRHTNGGFEDVASVYVPIVPPGVVSGEKE